MNRCSFKNLVAMLPVLIALLIAGCGSGGEQAPTPPANSISGKATLGATGLTGVTMNVVGPSSSTPITDDAGNFRTGSVANGNYTITPSRTGYTFVPASQTINVAGGSVSVPQFTATPLSTSYTVSGQVRLNGAGLAGVTVAIAGAGAGTITTDAGGNYSFPGVANGNCTITASLSGYTFSPLSQTVTVAGGNVSVPDFIATATGATFTISGNVALNGIGVNGVTVTISGGVGGSATTDFGGNYAFGGVQDGSYTVTPSLTGYTFTPGSRNVTVTGAASPGQDFSALPVAGGSISIEF